MTTNENNSLLTEITEEESATVCGGGDLLERVPDASVSYAQVIGNGAGILRAYDNLKTLAVKLSQSGVDVNGIINELQSLKS